MTQWRKSSYSGSTGQSDCVEVAQLSGDIGVRDSKDPGGLRVTLHPASFRDLVAEIKRGDHDMP
ncbi:DUF397 domain-containing protein [Actinomadura terrae]|uniref:DUF397 domain-containing protein n=1 Tax=Actinomadura terrae TaxID=604353 RepID=UPI001FA7458D|nr:DUF397 domain-containing protein [Actinomadura terrae]